MDDAKPPEDYYTRHLNSTSVIIYFGLMFSIFLAFGYIREKRQDKRKVAKDKVGEMMCSFGLKDFYREHLLTVKNSKNTILRTVITDENVYEESKPGYFAWVKELWQVRAEEVRTNCGLESHLYLTFVKRSAYFFGWVAFISGSTLLPTYLSGETNEEHLAYSLEKYTLLNAIGKPFKMWVVFTVTIVIGISGHLFVYFFSTSL